MSYTKNSTWAQRQGTNLNRYLKTGETANEVLLTNAPTTLTDVGTSFSAVRMNNIESGIFQNSMYTRKAIADEITLDESSFYMFTGAIDISGSIDIPETTTVKFMLITE
jgi:hypothetical protein